MTSRRSREMVKRRRESYQLFLQPQAELPPHRCSRTESNGLPPQPYEASHAFLLSEGRGDAVSAFERCSTSANAISAVASSSLHRCTRASPTSETAASLPARDPNTLQLRLRPVRVDIVRGDTGRRTSFLLATTIRYAWHHGNRVYRSLAGEEAGVELRETVVCEVVSAPSSPSSWAACPSAAAWHQQALLCNEEVPVASPTNAAAAITRAASLTPSSPFLSAAPCACYSYEATQVSRRLAPPTSPGWQAVDVAADLGSSTPALFVECLLKCVHDEVALSDDCGWVYLYHGRHIVSEIGRTRILRDIFAHAYDGDHSNDDATAEGGVPLATLTICVFRKH